MKKIVALLLSLACVVTLFSLVACGGSNPNAIGYKKACPRANAAFQKKISDPSEQAEEEAALSPAPCDPSKESILVSKPGQAPP